MDIDEHNDLLDEAVVQGAGGYGIINQNDNDGSPGDQPSYSIQIPRDPIYTSRLHSPDSGGKKHVLIKLCIFGTITLVFTIFFMFTLSRKDIKTYTTFSDEISLLHTPERGIHCPDLYSFSPVKLRCLKCPSFCLTCQPGIGGSNPCVRCLRTFSLMGEQCLKNCPHGYQNYEGICLTDKDRRFHTGHFKLNDTIQTEIEYMLYVPKSSASKVVFLLPPVGSNQLYFSQMTDLSKFSDVAGATLITVATPVEQIAKFVPPLTTSQYDEEYEFAFIQLLAVQLLSLVEVDDVVEYYYIGLSDSLFIAHQLSHYMQKVFTIISIKNNICKKCSHILMLLQTSSTRLQSSLRLDQLELGIVLGYSTKFYLDHKMNNNKAINHKDQVTHSEDQDDDYVAQTMKAAQEFKNRYNMLTINKPSFDIEVMLLNELGSDSKAITADIRKNQPLKIEMVEVNMSSIHQEQQKIGHLVSETLLDLISQHGSWNIREQIYKQL